MRVASIAAALVVAGGAIFSLAAPASAAEKDGNCDIAAGTGEFCVFDTNASTADFQNPDANHGDDVFLPDGQPVLGNAAVVRNADTARTAIVYSGINFTGAFVVLTPNSLFENPPPGGTGSNDWL